jgi:hypothetical protein
MLSPREYERQKSSLAIVTKENEEELEDMEEQEQQSDHSDLNQDEQSNPAFKGFIGNILMSVDKKREEDKEETDSESDQDIPSHGVLVKKLANSPNNQANRRSSVMRNTIGEIDSLNNTQIFSVLDHADKDWEAA